MYEKPIHKMVCDSDRGDGGIYFYEEYLEWRNRDTGRGFKIAYKNIKNYEVIYTQKKKVTIYTNSGEHVNLYLYKYEELLEVLSEMVERAKKGPKPEEVKEEKIEDEEDILTKLERLAKLHDSGALSDEEFQKAKDLILK